MQTKDEILLTRIADTIIRDLNPGGVSAFVVEKERWESNYPFKISKEAMEDLGAGLSNRIITMIRSSVSRFFLQFLNERDVIEIYFSDSESDSLDSHREDFYKWI